MYIHKTCTILVHIWILNCSWINKVRNTKWDRRIKHWSILLLASVFIYLLFVCLSIGLTFGHWRVNIVCRRMHFEFFFSLSFFFNFGHLLDIIQSMFSHSVSKSLWYSHFEQVSYRYFAMKRHIPFISVSHFNSQAVCTIYPSTSTSSYIFNDLRIWSSPE